MEKKMQKCAEDPKERMTTPQADGFFMPGEYEPHDGCILIWPSRPGSWIYGARDARIAFRDVIAAIAQSENVYVAAGRDAIDSAREMLTGEDAPWKKRVTVFDRRCLGKRCGADLCERRRRQDAGSELVI